MRAIGTLAALGIVLLLLTGCGHIAGGAPASDPSGDLASRVASVWEAKVRGDWTRVYEATTLEYRQKMSREAFLSAPHVVVASYEVQDMALAPSGDSALVRIKAVLRQAGFDFPATIKDTWRREGGHWRYAPPVAPGS